VSSTTVTSLRDANLARVLRLVHERGELTRAELTAVLGISRNTSAQLSDELVSRDLLMEGPAPTAGRAGRPSTLLRPGPAAPVAVVAEVAPQELRVAVVELGRTVSDLSVKPLVTADPDTVLAELIQQVTKRVDRSGRRCAGVGVALYGLVDAAGTVATAANLGWRDVAIGARLAGALSAGLPVTVDNDATVAALYEARHGAGRGARAVLYLYASVGVGGGLVIDGRLPPARHGSTGEVGHMLVNPAGSTCRCGSVGCWETEADRRALRRRSPTAGASDSDAARTILERATSGDTGARSAVDQTAAWFGEGLGSLLNILDPDRVIVAGFFADLLAAAPQTVHARARARSLTAGLDLTDLVVAAEHAPQSALLGAAERVLQPLLDPVAIA